MCEQSARCHQILHIALLNKVSTIHHLHRKNKLNYVPFKFYLLLSRGLFAKINDNVSANYGLNNVYSHIER